MATDMARFASISAIAATTLALASCSGSSDSDSDGVKAVENDPLVARTLNDPLMVDADLAYRSEANAAVTIRHDHALPPLLASSDAAEMAREAARAFLINGGQIADLPDGDGTKNENELHKASTASDLIAAANAPENCANGLEEGIIWAARMPDVTPIMPHGMVLRAAGSQGGCATRIVRYVTPTDADDALQFYFNLASRGEMEVARLGENGEVLRATGERRSFVVEASEGPGGTSAIDLVYWQS